MMTIEADTLKPFYHEGNGHLPRVYMRWKRFHGQPSCANRQREKRQTIHEQTQSFPSNCLFYSQNSFSYKSVNVEENGRCCFYQNWLPLGSFTLLCSCSSLCFSHKSLPSSISLSFLPPFLSSFIHIELRNKRRKIFGSTGNSRASLSRQSQVISFHT